VHNAPDFEVFHLPETFARHSSESWNPATLGLKGTGFQLSLE
jgi:hypothetical protein